MKKSIKIIITLALSFLLSGCFSARNDIEPKTNTINDVIAKSYMITTGMNKSEVMEVLEVKPQIIQRLNEDELWIYENEQINNETIENDFYTLMLKFKKGLVVGIGAYSCKVPNLDKMD
jgi:protein involved in sex pheromone biosynthesis